MNILQYCPAYRPNVGGLEFVVHTLAKELVALGHKSRILTPQSGAWPDDGALGVIRQPGLGEQLAALKWADAVVCHQDVLGLAWPLALTSKPSLMMIHVTPQKRRWPADRLMGVITKKCQMRAASRYLAGEVEEWFGVSCGVLPNPYDPENFFPPQDDVSRDTDFVFVGRLAMVKAADVFVEALGLLAAKGMRPITKIIGDGEERRKIQNLIATHGLDRHVKLLGELDAARIGQVLQRSYCLVIPSHYEPFGIVALEGRACGCKLVVTKTGGLPEAAGPSAVVVERSSAEAMASGLVEVLEQRSSSNLKSGAGIIPEKDLERHRPTSVALAYLSELQVSS